VVELVESCDLPPERRVAYGPHIAEYLPLLELFPEKTHEESHEEGADSFSERPTLSSLVEAALANEDVQAFIAERVPTCISE
jgi:hypothetical protein